MAKKSNNENNKKIAELLIKLVDSQKKVSVPYICILALESFGSHPVLTKSIIDIYIEQDIYYYTFEEGKKFVCLGVNK